MQNTPTSLTSECALRQNWEVLEFKWVGKLKHNGNNESLLCLLSRFNYDESRSPCIKADDPHVILLTIKKPGFWTLFLATAFKEPGAPGLLNSIMADSSTNGLTSLARALSQPSLDLIDVNDVSPPRSLQLHPGRRRKLSSCNSIENADLITSPCAAEARVLVINTGGTIGMTLHEDGSYGNHCHQLFVVLLCSS